MVGPSRAPGYRHQSYANTCEGVIPRREFYPEIKPFATRMLFSGWSAWDIYWEQSGNPKGAPNFLIGGPGARAPPRPTAASWIPSVPTIIIFDQRGCGRSKPLSETTDNTTPHLDRRHGEAARGVRSVFGGSWGSTLALAYAEHHPDRVKALALAASSAARARSTGSCSASGPSRRRSTATSSSICRRQSAPIRCSAAGRSRSQGAYAGGAQ